MSILRRTSKKGARPAAKPPRNRVTGREEPATFAAAFEEHGTRGRSREAAPPAYKTDATAPSGFAKVETVIRKARVYDISMYAALRATVSASRSDATKTVGDMVAYLHRLGFQEEPVTDAIETWTRHIQRSA